MELTEGWLAAIMIIMFMGGWSVGIVLNKDQSEKAWSAGYKRGLEAGKAKNEHR